MPRRGTCCSGRSRLWSLLSWCSLHGWLVDVGDLNSLCATTEEEFNIGLLSSHQPIKDLHGFLRTLKRIYYCIIKLKLISCAHIRFLGIFWIKVIASAVPIMLSKDPQNPPVVSKRFVDVYFTLGFPLLCV